MGRIRACVLLCVFAASALSLSGCGAANQVSYDTPAYNSSGQFMESSVRTAYDDRRCSMVEGVMR